MATLNLLLISLLVGICLAVPEGIRLRQQIAAPVSSNVANANVKVQEPPSQPKPDDRKDPKRDHKPPHYIIDLDERPDQRWRMVADDFKDMGRELKDTVKVLVDAFIPSDEGRKMVYALAEFVIKDMLPLEMSDELKGFADRTDVKMSDLVLYNLIYDLTAFKACTSIIAQDEMGHVFHGRNLDYDFSDFLRRSTILVEFRRREKVVYSGITFAYYVGLLTGQRPEAYTLSLDERDEGKEIDNLIMAFVTRMKHPVAWLMREVLAETEHFEEAVKRLSDELIIAPAYFIVGGQTGQGAVITRDRLGAINVWRLDPYNHGEWFLVETNYDHWKKAGDNRRDVAEKMLREIGQRDINDISLFGVLSTDPVKNKDTVFTTIMSAHQPEMMLEDTMIREDRDHKK